MTQEEEEEEGTEEGGGGRRGGGVGVGEGKVRGRNNIIFNVIRYNICNQYTTLLK